MKDQLIKFDFEYTEGLFSEKEIIEKGYKQLTDEALFLKICNQTIYGDYLWGYKFVTDIYENGKLEGINDTKSHHFGEWIINYENQTLITKWDKGWVDTITRAYDVNGNIEFYDVDTGKWRTTFKIFKKW